jgi:hypothetical protein
MVSLNVFYRSYIVDSQRCSNRGQPGQLFGISIDTMGGLVAVQKTALEWYKGNCAIHEDLSSAGSLPGVKVSNITVINGNLNGSTTSLTSRVLSKGRYGTNLPVLQVN